MRRHLEFARSFLRLYKKLPSGVRDKVNEAINDLISGIERGQVSSGLGLKRLTGDIWEARVDIDLRISFEMTGDLVKFLMVGGHDEIKRFLKN